MVKKYTIEGIKKHIESFSLYRDIVFVEEQKDDCVYFDAINKEGVYVSIRADVDSEGQVGVDKWMYYEWSEGYDWSQIP